MNPFNKLLLIPLVAVAIGGGVGIAAATNGRSAGDPVQPPATDVKGPCDELEHATDPRCSDAVLIPEAAGVTTDQAEPGDDNAQDENDPGEAEDQNDDNGQVSDDQGESEEEDNSGPSLNSGTGSSHDSGDDNGSDEDGQSGDDNGND